jgi:DNA-binding transcriptional ArsR family regulator
MSNMQKNNLVLSALGHPLRRKIIQVVDGNTNGGVSPKMLSDDLGQSLGVVSYHVRLLADAGVLKLVGTKGRRGAVEHFYRRSGGAVDKTATEVLELIGKD